MKKLLKLSIVLLLLLILFFTNHQVEATNVEQIDNIIGDVIEEDTEESKIMMYDAETGETTEVDFDNLKELIEAKADNKSTNDRNIELFVPKTFGYNNIMESRVGLIPAIGKIKCSGGNGSGVLVARNLVLTAAHCVWDEETKEVLSGWEFRAGVSESGALEINGTKMISGWGRVYYDPKWKETPGVNSNYDWALCELYLPMGDYGIRPMQAAVPPTFGFSGTRIGTIGYPTAYQNGVVQWQQAGKVEYNFSYQFCPSFLAPSEGISGAPVFSAGPVANGVWSAEGTYDGKRVSVATKLTDRVITIINSYK